MATWKWAYTDGIPDGHFDCVAVLIECWVDKLFSRMGFRLDSFPYYSGKDLMTAFEGVVVNADTFEWINQFTGNYAGAMYLAATGLVLSALVVRSGAEAAVQRPATPQATVTG